jgi:hypothetical protein
LRKTIFILNLIFSTLIFAQNSESSNLYDKEYYDLLNYIPKNLKADTIHKLESPFFKGGLNTIGSIMLYNGIRKEFKFSENDNKWLDKRIDQIASELFGDGKKLLMSRVGGYSGCPDKMIDTFRLNNIDIIDLKFCHSCTDALRNKDFIEKFNRKMYSLLEIEPANGKTYRFYGKFIGYTKRNKGLELILNQDRTFKFWKRKEHSSDFTQGLWENRNDTLILNSKDLTENNKIDFELSSVKWIDFKNIEFILKKDKIVEFNKGTRKLKKLTE